MTDQPVLRLTWAAFKALPEYSRSLPTGQTPGKRWRRHAEIFDKEAARLAYPDAKEITNVQARPFMRTRLYVGEYGQPNGKSIPITWYRPIIICQSGEGL